MSRLRLDALNRLGECFATDIVSTDICGAAVQLGRDGCIRDGLVTGCREVAQDVADNRRLDGAHRRLHVLAAPAQLCNHLAGRPSEFSSSSEFVYRIVSWAGDSSFIEDQSCQTIGAGLSILAS